MYVIPRFRLLKLRHGPFHEEVSYMQFVQVILLIRSFGSENAFEALCMSQTKTVEVMALKYFFVATAKTGPSEEQK